MRRISITVIILTFVLPVIAAASKSTVKLIDPPHWWTGMTDTSLQLQIYGNDIRSAEPFINYPGVKIDSVVRLEGSPNYQFLYLTINPDTKPGKITITWRDGKHKITRDYELKPRTRTDGAQGFTSADVLYMIMPDRFADGNPDNNKVATMRHPIGADRQNLNVRHGGDLKGIINHLDYIDSLGVTAVWLNPVLENDMPGGSYHGYATTDYYRVDPRLGSNAEYRALTDSLHNRGIKMVMDMIFNHCGSEHIWALDMPSADWINFAGQYTQTNHKLASLSDPYASEYDRKMATDGWFVKEMPDLNQRNPHLMKYLVQNSIWWIEEAGIDGIRMDTYPYADKQAMAEWIKSVEKQYPDFTIVGECWFAEPGLVQGWQRDSRIPVAGQNSNLPVIMDFPFMIKNRGLQPYTEQTDEWNDGLVKIYNHFALDHLYANPYKLLRFLDNHDTERVLLSVPDKLDGWKQAVTILLTVPGIPQIYYGTEMLMSGDRKKGDGNVRRDMPGGFPDDSVNIFTPAGRSTLQNEAYDFLRHLLQWRKNATAIHQGNMKHFAPSQGVYVYQRYLPADNNRVTVILNGTDKPVALDMQRYKEILSPGQEWQDIITGQKIIPVKTDGSPLELYPRATLILQPSPSDHKSN